ncbi:MAG: hypothetical protein A2504_13045 [Bdellovibrionales bacterium RIFOXYD12_FULL_39_22]|nr:MAG: hypothetical protein A2385_00845 [Bdellovibrionales bacterium RIFOXYB1_FULL_39_21]OFZ43555.1 MAG: hypothetical protein A2485_12515 [Bdellovibrionales bacterium RIFOXYC12_FULL_39_17]OFZ44574.1 MAG: hypothetical protein A2404_10205 [Bdellovibrionales bacterium RIFOXYC1_FULL_39_130]OFZ76333.1 MAG: hypothetical protein A2560_06825 [Bdellovibrionales bacterium RIFOXYD1_FULL_39_84]OFZ94599.1 MAG: hypothetical protein A2504_13045 [Bdellovibrionales bacterium RIFOXYD12_FULL_39_22]HLE12947.1 hy
MRKLKRLLLSGLLTIIISSSASADMFGGDIVVLTQLLSNALQQLVQLREIVGNGQDTLGMMRDINQGIRDGLDLIRIINPKFNPGLYSNLDTADRVLGVINELYGKVPQTAEFRLQQAQDQSVAESISMNGNLFEYADQVDLESKRIMDHAKVVSPQGAEKLNAQSLAVLIGVTTQLLRTNSMMLKMMGENMALSNRKEKLQSAQFKNQYDGMSSALGKLPRKNSLPSL